MSNKSEEEESHVAVIVVVVLVVVVVVVVLVVVVLWFHVKNQKYKVCIRDWNKERHVWDIMTATEATSFGHS